nr:carboxypeptidase regulatory-like domain-containing protein [uncultured Halomonas sp.]
MRKGIAIAVLGLVLAGCQAIGPSDSGPPPVEDLGTTTGQQRVDRKVPFPAQEYARLDKTGSATVTGRLFLETSSGVVPGAGETVSIAPATQYSAEAAEVALTGRAIEPADPRAREYTHYVTTDARGYFQATGLPAGVFYIAGSVKPPGGERRIIINQISLGEGQTLEVSLSR